ncbi:MAG: energy transducer TonB [Bacteroidia bacterium]|jgi:TonB family protein|nr:energy transducer TonB [Bacteroidia bacterium]
MSMRIRRSFFLAAGYFLPAIFCVCHSQTNVFTAQLPDTVGYSVSQVNTLPQFPGGDTAFDSYLRKNQIWPYKAAEEMLTATVRLSFVIDSSGYVRKVKVIQSTDTIFNREAIRLISLMPQWKPALLHNKPVACAMEKEILFEKRKQAKSKLTYLKDDELPMFPGGEAAMMNYLADSLRYPPAAKAAGKQGKVFVRVEIDTAGKISEAVVIKGIDNAPELHAEALRLVYSMPAWSPCKINGRPVKMEMILQVKFELK